MRKRCTIEGCERDLYARAYCAMHYQRFKKHGNAGSAELLRKAIPDPCKVEGCDEGSKSKGYCNMHYRRVQKHGQPGGAAPNRWLGSPECKVEGCTNDSSKGGWGYCGMHYRRVKDKGDAGIAEPITGNGLPIRDRILRRVYVNPETGCWEWSGATTRGYGSIGLEQKVILVHRWMYEHTYGPIPEGLVIDHICVNPPCCFPEHLEVVTRAENNRRGGWGHGARKLVKP